MSKIPDPSRHTSLLTPTAQQALFCSLSTLSSSTVLKFMLFNHFQDVGATGMASIITQLYLLLR